MQLEEAIKYLRNKGFICEDTDSWSADDLDPTMSDEERRDAALNHNNRRRIWYSIGGDKNLAGRHVDMHLNGNNTPAARAWTKAMARNEKESDAYKRITELENELKRVKNPERKKEIQQTLDLYKNRLKQGTEEHQNYLNDLEGEDISMFAYAIQKILNKKLEEKGKQFAEIKGKNWFEARWWIHIKHAVDDILYDDKSYMHDWENFKKALNPNVDFNGDPNEVAEQIAPDVWELMMKRYDDWTY